MTIHHGDCLEVMRTMDDTSISCVLTDPPYGLHFMGKSWDHGIPGVEYWAEMLRICKPGAMLLAFGGTRTFHRLTCAIEDAGWEIRDCLMWIYGSGFCKSHNFGCICKGEPVQYNHDKISLSISENMQNLQSDVSMSEPLSSCEKQNLLKEVPQSSNEHWQKRSKSSSRSEKNNNSSLCGVLERNCEEQLSSQEDTEPDLFENLQRQGKIEESCELLRQRQGKETTRKGIGPRKESCMEGRSDIQEEQGELHRSQVCEMSSRIHSYGEEGRLHNGTSACDGQTSEQITGESRSSSSQGSQYQEQFHREFGTIYRQQDSQNSGMATCEKCGRLKDWKGWGTALKPSWEPIIMAMKPLDGTYKKNVERWGQGGINIDACRIEACDQDKLAKNWDRETVTDIRSGNYGNGVASGIKLNTEAKLGRWPANTLFEESASEMLDQKSEINASRFFYCAKTSSAERNKGCEDLPDKLTKRIGDMGTCDNARPNAHIGIKEKNFHPTVKPLKLTEYLLKLIMPPNGVVLDPFMGSGTTLLAAKNLGMQAIGIEKEAEYVEIAKRRVESA